MSIPCFLLKSTTRVRRSLRRYALDHKDDPPPACPVHGVHDAQVLLDEIEDTLSEGSSLLATDDKPPDLDPRWPRMCACGYVFRAFDPFQLFEERIYERVDTHTLMTRREAPIGAMFYAPWLIDLGWVGPDGRSLVVKVPGGDQWNIDGPASSGGHWTRTGTPPAITVTPSIQTPRWHGWLRDGVLIDA